MKDISTQNKIKIRDAIRLGTQSAVAGGAMYLLMSAFSLPEKFVGILSAVLVIEKSIGASWGKSWERFAATLVGCAIGLLCLLALPDGYRTIVSLTVSMFVINMVAGFRPKWRYGVVAAVALSLGSSENVWETAGDRCLAIGLGVAIGSLVSVVIWPEKSSTRAWRDVRLSLRGIAGYLKHAIHQSIAKDEDKEFEKFANQYSTNISDARSSAAEVRIADNDDLMDAINATDRLYHSVVMIRQISEKSNQLGGDSEDLTDSIKKIQELCCDCANRLSENEDIDSATLKEIEEETEKLEDAFSGSEDLEKQTFVFAVREIADGLGKLDEYYPRDE